MKKKKIAMYLGVVLGITAVCIVLNYGKVFSGYNDSGKFISSAPYVDTSTVTESIKEQDVTSAGGNQMSDIGSGKQPCSTEVPTAKGEKGTKTNPFVVLEIVPDKAMQQLCYLTGDKEQSGLDALEIGIDAVDGTAWSYADDSKPSFDNLNLGTKYGWWFANYTYNVYSFQTEDEETDDEDDDAPDMTLPYLEVSKLHSVKITEDSLKAAGYDATQFVSDYTNYVNIDQNQKQQKYDALVSMIANYSDFFVKDSDKNVIEDIVKEDGRNWKITKTSKGSSHYEVVLSLKDISDVNVDKNSSKDEIAAYVAAHKTDFQKDKDGNVIPDSAIEDEQQNKNWTITDIQESKVDYNYTVVDTTIAKADYDAVENNEYDIAWLIEKYKSVFKKDKDGNKIQASQRQDGENWKMKCESEEVNKYDKITSGYFYYAGSAEGQYAVGNGVWDSSTSTYYNSTIYESSNSNDNVWCYAATEDELPEGVVSEGKNWWSNDEKYNSSYYWSLEKFNGGYQTFAFSSKVTEYTYTFTYQKTDKTYSYYFTYDAGEQNVTYNFEYWGLKTNNILKRSLFVFGSQEDCDDFQLQVICMTPAEINEIAKKDTSETLDMIERADMIYFSLYGSNTDNISKVYELYHKYVKGNSEYDFSKEGELKSFYENDLEWSQCMKLLYRLSSESSLPIVYTQKVGEMLTEGVTRDSSKKETTMYITSEEQNLASQGSLNNISKLYLITLQFDLLTRKSNPDNIATERTFTDDILPKIQTVSLTDNAISGADTGTATTTGYYVRKEPTKTSLTTEEKQACFYLWNQWTFYPEEIGGNKDYGESHHDEYLKYGYLESFFDTNVGNPFVSFDASLSHQSGSRTGDSGKEYDGNNVTIVSAVSNSDVNHSTMLGNKESAYITNDTLRVVYKIMNNDSKKGTKPDDLEVVVQPQKKRYFKLSDLAVLIDYDKDAKYKSDEELYVKVTISNPNNESGIVKGIVVLGDSMVKSDSYETFEDFVKKGSSFDTYEEFKNKVTSSSGAYETIPLDDVSSAGDNQQKKEKVKDSMGTEWGTGYIVNGGTTVYVYIPYSLLKWKDGYATIRFYTEGRCSSQLDKSKTKKMNAGSETYCDVTIDQRTLFNLQ